PECRRGCECRRHGCDCGERGRGSCLCAWTAHMDPPGCPEKPCRWGKYDVYITDGVDLACLEICEPATECKPPAAFIEDDCAPRRIVKSNDILYDLIRGCDLTRIERLSWGAWHRREEPVPWKEFIEKLEGEQIDECILKTRLSVT